MNVRTQHHSDVRVSGRFDWDSIEWKTVEKSVRKLQERIVKAQRDGRYGKVRALSQILTRSFAAKALAVKRVTQVTCDCGGYRRLAIPCRRLEPCDGKPSCTVLRGG